MLALQFIVVYYMMDLILIKMLNIPKQKNNALTVLLYSCILAVYDLFTYATRGFFKITWYGTFFIIIPIFLFLLYKVNKFKDKRVVIASLISFFAILFINNIASNFLFELFGFDILKIPYDGIYGAKNVIAGALYLIIIYQLFEISHAKLDIYQVTFKEALFIFILLAITGAFVTDIFSIGRDSTDSMLGMLISKIALFSGLLVIYLLFLNINQKSIIRQSKLTEQQTRLVMSEQIAHYEKMKSLNETIVILRHNIMDDYEFTRTLLQNKEYDRATAHLEKITGKIKNASKKILEETGNKDVNLIWANLINSQDYQHITVDWLGRDLAYIPLEDRDVIYLFSNVLNNAFEAASKNKEGYVTVKTGIKNESVLILIKNNYSELNPTTDGNFISTKGDLNVHGYGTKIIKDIVSKYNGFVKYEYAETEFTTKIVLPRNKKA